MKSMTVEDNVEAYAPGRDIWTPEKRREEWEKMHAVRQRNIEQGKQDTRPFNQYVVLWSADVGGGKTICAAVPFVRYYIDGMSISSNVSLKFGDTMEGVDNYNIDESTEDNSGILADEAHLIVNKYSAISLRQVHFNNELANIRKGGKRIQLATAEEDKISSAVKTEIDWVCYPVTYVPSVVRRGGNWPGLPPWCYKRVVRIGPRPWRGHRLADRFPRAGISRAKVSVWFDYPNPMSIYYTSAVVDSFEKPNLREFMNMGGKQFREAVDGDLGEPPPDEAERDVFADVFNALAVALGHGEELNTYNEYEYLASLVRKYAPPPPLSNGDVLSVLKESNVPVSSRLKVKKSDLLEKAFNIRATGSPE